MGETVRVSECVEPLPLRFTASVDGVETTYPDEYDCTTTKGVTDFYWDAGFVVGWAAAQGYKPEEITLKVYQGDKLIEVT